MSNISNSKYLSNHRVEVFLSCERQLEYYLDGTNDHVMVGDVTPRTFGSALHDALEALFLLPKGKRTLDALLDTYDDACKRCSLKWHTYEDGKVILRNWFSKSRDILEKDVLSVEEKFEIDVGGVPVVGVLDRLDKVDGNTVDITDYKSGFVPMNKWEIENSLQLGIYNLAVRIKYPWVKKVRTIYDFLRWQRSSTEMEEHKLAGLRRYLRVIWDRMKKCENPTATVSAACRWCDYRYKCPDYKKVSDSGEFVVPSIDLDSGNLTGILREYDTLKALLDSYDTRKSEIENWLKSEMIAKDIERFEHSDWQVSLSFQRRVNYDYATIRKIFEPLGMMDRITYFKKAAVDAMLQQVTLTDEQEAELVTSSSSNFTAPSLKVQKKRGRAAKKFNGGVAK